MRLMMIFTLMIALNISPNAQGDVATLMTYQMAHTLYSDLSMIDDPTESYDEVDLESNTPEEIFLENAEIELYANNGPVSFTIENLPATTQVSVYTTTGQKVNYSQIDNTFHLMTKSSDHFLIVLKDPNTQYSVKKLLVF